MIKKVSLTVLAAVIVIASICFAFPAFANSTETAEAEKVTVTGQGEKLLDMLNRSFVYNGTFDNPEETVNESIIALLDLTEDEFIEESTVADFIYNMYGKKDIDFSTLNTDFPKKEGFVYIIPRGYTVYEHSLKSVTENTDGTLTVVTNVDILTHDGGEFTAECVSVFKENKDSAYGYNILSSDIQE